MDALEFVNNTLEAREEEISDREPRLRGRIEEEVDVFNQLFIAVVNDVVRHGAILLLLIVKPTIIFTLRWVRFPNRAAVYADRRRHG